MPTFVVTAPDGKKYRVTAPEGATQDEVLERIQAQRAQTETEAQPRPAPRKRPTGAQAASGAAQNVLGNLAKGVAWLPDMLAEAGKPILDAANNVVAAGGSAVLDAVGQPEAGKKFARFVTAPNRAPAVTVRAAVDRAMPAARAENDRSGSGFAAQLLGAAVTPNFMPVKEAPRRVLQQAQKGSVYSKLPEAATGPARIVEEGARNNVRVFTTDVKPPTSGIGKTLKQTFPEKVPFTGMGGPRAAQQGERVEAVKGLLREYGADADKQFFDDAANAIDDVAARLAKTRGDKLSTLSTAKNSVIDGIEGSVPVSKTIQAIDDQIAKLQSINPEKLSPVIQELESWKRTLGNKSLRGLEENRKILGEAFSAPELASIKKVGEDALNPIYGALREDMGAFIRTQGGQGAFNKWSTANEQLASMAGELKASTFKNVLRKADITPEAVGRLLFSKDRSEVQRLVSNLDDVGKQKAQSAVLQRAFDRAISANEGVSVERFLNNLKGMGDSVGVTFTGADKQRVDGLVRLLDATRRAAESQANPATGAQNTLPLIGAYLGQAMGFGGTVGTLGGAGVLARIYESAPMRNLLTGLSKTKVGSPQEAQFFQRIIQAGAPLGKRVQETMSKAANDAAGMSPGKAVAQDEQNAGQEIPQ